MGWMFINNMPVMTVRSDIDEEVSSTADSTEVTADSTEITVDTE